MPVLRLRGTAAAAIFAMALGTAGPVAASSPDGVGYCTPPRPSSPASALPLAAVAPLSRILGRYEPGYRVTRMGGGLAVRGRAQRLTTSFGRDGVTVRSGRVAVRMRLAGYGYGTRLRPVRLAAPVARANRVIYQGGPLAQWYANGPAGLEQGFTVTAAQSGAAGHAPLTLALAASGGAQATMTDGGVIFHQAGAALAYRNLAVTDARGQHLPAWLTLAPGRVLIHTDTAGARYPLTVDPLFAQVAKLTAGGSGDQLGTSATLSGNTAVVGAPGATVGGHHNAGAVYVFIEPSGGWADETQAAAELTADDPAEGAWLGYSVAMDGGTIVAGAPYAGGNAAGAVYLFTEPGGGWADGTQTAKLTASSDLDNALLGVSVAISGTTVVGGAPGDFGCGPTGGAAYVFTEPGGGWTSETQTGLLYTTEGTPADALGFSVAIDGPTIVAGAPLTHIDDAYVGALYVFTEPDGGWQTESQAARLLGTAGPASAALGVSVAISGGTVAGGAPFATIGGNGQQGAAFVFTEPGGGWADETQAAMLTDSRGSAGEDFGYSVATDGPQVVVGAFNALVRGHAHQGAAFVFTEPGGGWTDETQNAPLNADDGAAGDNLGAGVAISGDTVAAGAPSATAGAGAAYVFGPAAPPPPPPPPGALRLGGFLSPGRGSHWRAGSTVLVRTRVDYANGTPIPGWLAVELAHGCELTVRATGAQSSPARCLRWNAAKQRFYWTWHTRRRPTGAVTLTVNLYYHSHDSITDKLVLTPAKRRPGQSHAHRATR